MSKPLASFLSPLFLCATTAGDAQLSQEILACVLPSCFYWERQSVVPWGIRVQLVYGLFSGTRDKPTSANSVVHHPRIATLLGHFHPPVVARGAMGNWCENSPGASSFSWLRGGPVRTMIYFGE